MLSIHPHLHKTAAYFSEHILQRKLDDARISRCRGDRSKGSRHTSIQCRVGKLRGIERVKELRAELHGMPFADPRELGKSDIPIELARTEQDTNAGVAELGWQRAKEIGHPEWNRRGGAKRARVQVPGS